MPGRARLGESHLGRLPAPDRVGHRDRHRAGRCQVPRGVLDDIAAELTELVQSPPASDGQATVSGGRRWPEGPGAGHHPPLRRAGGRASTCRPTSRASCGSRWPRPGPAAARCPATARCGEGRRRTPPPCCRRTGDATPGPTARRGAGSAHRRPRRVGAGHRRRSTRTPAPCRPRRRWPSRWPAPSWSRSPRPTPSRGSLHAKLVLLESDEWDGCPGRLVQRDRGRARAGAGGPGIAS